MATQVPQQPIRQKGERRRRQGNPQPETPNQRRPRQVDREHKALVAQLPSILSGKGPCEVCHVRFADAERGKRETGMAEKPSDKWTLPLTPEEHRQGPDAQHGMNERAWWEAQGIDPLAACEDLWAVSQSHKIDDDERPVLMLGIIAAHKALGEIRRAT